MATKTYTSKSSKTKTVSKGQKQHRAATPLHANFHQVYQAKQAPFDLDSQQFRLWLIRPGMNRLRFDDRIESIEWRDEGNQYNLNTIPVLRGTIAWRRDDPAVSRHPVEVLDGHQFRCEVKWLGKWEPLWLMRVVAPPEHTVEDGTAKADIADDLILATLSRGTFRYTKNKKRKLGWLYHEIVVDVCKQFQIPIGSLVQGTERITDLSPPGQVSPLEVIRQAVLKEQDATGRRFIIAWRPHADDRAAGGTRFALNVMHPTRNPLLYTLRAQIRQATSSPLRRANIATSVTATGSSKKAKGKRKKMSATASAVRYVRQFGFIVRNITVSGNPSRDELTKRAKAELAKNIQQTRVLSNFQHYGIAFVRRGDVMKINLPEEGYKGDAAYMFVVSVTHSLSPTDYTMALDLTWRDPMDPEATRQLRESAQRKKKRASHGKKKKKKGA